MGERKKALQECTASGLPSSPNEKRPRGIPRRRSCTSRRALLALANAVEQELTLQAQRVGEVLANLVEPGLLILKLSLPLTHVDLERAGQVDEAINTYATALEVYPDHLPTLQAMSRLLLRTNRADDDTYHMLQKVALRSESLEWREWAMKHMALMEP